ncbi:MAG: hypothetical protein ABI467_21965 [Kofleriaceae bacterium]
MGDAWQMLRAGGVPIVLERSALVPSPAALATSARAAIAAGAAGREGEALAAWLFAWHHHWPSSFAEQFVDDRDAILAWASAAALDDNRYLKLRRIAIENLSTIL